MRTHAVFIGGRSGVGKTSVALAVHSLLRDKDVRHAVIEGDYLDLAHPTPWKTNPDFGLAERNLSAMWANYRELGYQRLIYTNTAAVVSIPSLIAAMGDQPRSTGILLSAADHTVEQRLGSRESGDELRRSIESSARSAAWLEASAPSEIIRLDTNGQTPAQIAQGILSRIGW